MTIPLRPFALAALSVLAIIPAACGDEEGDGQAVETTTTTAAPEATEVTLTAQLSGREEVPGPGVTDGTGLAEVRIAADELCYTLNATMGEAPTAVHIHQGAQGAAGGVVVNLMPTFEKGESAFTAESCITPDAAAVAPIAENPSAFYVNIHTAQFPDGAMRGQLSEADS